MTLPGTCVYYSGTHITAPGINTGDNFNVVVTKLVDYIDAGGSGTVTSVGLTMPAAFSVAGSPVTSSGTLAVTGAGNTNQYIRGDGTLDTFPTIPSYTFNNAITETASVVQLGGDLTQLTLINTTSSFDLFVTSSGTLTPPYTLLGVSGSGNFVSLQSLNGSGDGSTITLQSTGITLTCTSGGDIAFNSTVRMNNRFGLGAGTMDATVTNSLQAFNGVAPSVGITDGYILYSQDISAGNAAAHFIAEAGEIVSLGAEVGMQSNHDLVLVTNATEKLRVTTDGRLYGTTLHNNAGAVTGTTNQYIASGTYTPTLTNGTNVAASTPYQSQWIRVGNVVTVSGMADIDLSSPGAYELGISIPIASDFTIAANLGGVLSSSVSGDAAGIEADPANNRASVQGANSDDTNHSHHYSFTYLIL